MKMTKLKTLGLCSIEPMQLQDYWFSERRRETFSPQHLCTQASWPPVSQAKPSNCSSLQNCLTLKTEFIS